MTEVVKTALAQLLEGKSGDFIEKVCNYLVQWRLDPSDPLFIVMAGMGQVSALIEDTPSQIEVASKTIFTELNHTVEKATILSIEKQKEEIAKVALELIKQVESRESTPFLTTILPASAVVLGALAVGLVAGITIPPFFAPQLDPTGPIQLSLDEAIALQWATSSEGKQARELWELNKGWLDTKRCEQQIQEMGIQLKFGSQSVSNGFCILWIKPPQQRVMKTEP
jgi:hypothetical protein